MSGSVNTTPKKSIRDYLTLAIPKAGISHFTETYLTWFTVGFVSSLVAGALDKYAGGRLCLLLYGGSQ